MSIQIADTYTRLVFHNGKFVHKTTNFLPTERLKDTIIDELLADTVSTVIANIIYAGGYFPIAKHTPPANGYILNIEKAERTYGKYKLHAPKQTTTISARQELPYIQYKKEMKHSIITNHKIISLFQKGNKLLSYSTDGIGRLFHKGKFVHTRKLTRGQFLHLAIAHNYTKIPDIVKPFKKYETEKTIYIGNNRQEQICIW